MNSDHHFYRLFLGTMCFSIFFIVVCGLIFFLLPSDDKKPHVTLVDTSLISSTEVQEPDEQTEQLMALEEAAKLNPVKKRDDAGLALYRQDQSKVAVEWFYTHLVDNRDVALAILDQADKNDIPLSLAFALAHTESNFNVHARNRNSNQTIDRGLFQLNSASFPRLKEEDFYNPEISAKYGLSHLKYCMKNAGNEIAALAMYNAGAGRVRSNGTPQMTLNYISKIESYRTYIEDHFNVEVLAFYDIDEHEMLLARK